MQGARQGVSCQGTAIPSVAGYLVSPEVGAQLDGVAGDVQLHALAWCSCAASRLDAEVWLEGLDIPSIRHRHLTRILQQHLLVCLQQCAGISCM